MFAAFAKWAAGQAGLGAAAPAPAVQALGTRDFPRQVEAVPLSQAPGFSAQDVLAAQASEKRKSFLTGVAVVGVLAFGSYWVFLRPKRRRLENPRKKKGGRLG